MRRRELLGSAAAGSLCFGQNPKPAFEVASIKPNNSGQGMSLLGGPDLSHGIFKARNVTVRALLQFACNVQDFLVSGGPGWMGSDRFDVDAKADGPLTVEQGRVLVQGMLEDSS